MTKTSSRLGFSILLLIVTAVGVLIVGPRFKDQLPAIEQQSDEAERLVEVAGDQRSAVRLARSVVQRLPITTSPVESSSVPLSLELSGTLMLDADNLSHVHTRFPGEVIEVGKRASDGRPLTFGMPVSKGQLLAVIWSRDLGEKKSELVDALARLRIDNQTLKALRELDETGATSARSVREAHRNVLVAQIATSRAERTLRSWNLAESEITAIEAEAERISKGEPHNKREDLNWARVDIVSPLDGVIVERNFSLGDLVDTDDDLFLVAQVNRLRVAAHAYEESLSALDALPASRRLWSLAVPADPAVVLQRGEFDQIGRIIDPNQHTALVMGWVDNSQGQLRVGQFITATIDLPAHQHEVAVPAAAIVDEGSRSLVFVQTDPSEPVFTKRQVAVTRRSVERVLINGQPTAAERARGAEPLAPDELVVVSGTVQLASSLHDLQASAGADR